MLPPLLAEELHDPDHSIFSVTVTPPNIPQPSAFSSRTDLSGYSGASPVQSTDQPTEEDLRTAVPHPNAYYCPRENGWVIFYWKSSSVAPPLAKSFLESSHPPLPDQGRRKRQTLCIGETGGPFGRANKTHHFHKYEKAFDAHKLAPPFRRDDWVLEGSEESEDGKLLDLYVCCQCCFYCVASGIIPGVIPRKNFDGIVRERTENPPPGKIGEQAVVQAFEVILLVIENKLWKAENRMLRVSRSSFQQKIGWNANIKRIFDILGFTEDIYKDEIDFALRPPVTDTVTAHGQQNRKKLLRAWVETGAWLNKMTNSAALVKDMRIHKLHVKIESAREMCQFAIGAHPDQIPRGELHGTLYSALQNHQRAWQELGLTPSCYSPDLLAFGYLAQCRCDPARTVTYFTHISNLLRVMQEMGSYPSSLQDLIAVERSRGRFVANDIANAAAVLGFGPDGPLRVEYDDTDVPDDFIENTWKECIQRSWHDPVGGSSMQRDANEAFRILAESRGSVKLRRVWELGKKNLMTPERAYDILEIPKDVDDYMLITVFNMRLEEQLMKMDKMQQALLVIAEGRNSERLRQFLASGQDPGDIAAYPVGLIN
ncbi:hypothetical protein M378DRAFT_15386 [Amanita muscaria Koide BX008]|uniref:UCH repeated domain-containing protein n=1 Tax=Amanita muscaria (strain Koide BX008) TaxID=946122 RepID=A0A0C2WQR6_AMAMK|nr:hypothetical protein M378DRAFT_15386 [Amanita muscaria Koide BX008]